MDDDARSDVAEGTVGRDVTAEAEVVDAPEPAMEIIELLDSEPVLRVQPNDVLERDSVEGATPESTGVTDAGPDIVVAPSGDPDPAGEIEVPEERDLAPAGAPNAGSGPRKSTVHGAAESDVAPLAESRLAVGEDPEDAFRDWVDSATTGVLKRALPELENRAEMEKALLVIRRLAQLEDREVEFKTRLVNTLEKLGRTPQATDACLALARALEAQEREAEAHEAYQRVLRIQPGNEDACTALERLGDVEPTAGEEAIDVRPTPYMPDHMSSKDTSAFVEMPKPTNGAHSNGHGNGSLGEAPRPYSGVAGGAEAGDDFEKLLTEFRAELHQGPRPGGASSRTELGANLKQMGRLDDAIRELQAAVREPSPPPIAYELLGEAFLEKGQGRIAVRLLEKALGTLSHGDRELMGILYQLGHAYELTSEKNKALMCYERIFSVDIDYRDIQERILACSA